MLKDEIKKKLIKKGKKTKSIGLTRDADYKTMITP
jgi:hypothetical protein